MLALRRPQIRILDLAKVDQQLLEAHVGRSEPDLHHAEKAIGQLDFAAPDEERFPALRLARTALTAGGARPAILNASNEVAVAAFLAGRIGFLEIADMVEAVLDRRISSLPRLILVPPSATVSDSPMLFNCLWSTS